MLYSTFELVFFIMSKISLQASNGQYVCAEGGGGQQLVANRGTVGSWETFTLTDLGNGKIALQASNGQYVCAESGGGQQLVANRGAIGSWETFTLTDLGNGKIALQASNGQYVCAEGGGGQQLVANRSAIGPWETFIKNHLEETQQDEHATIRTGDISDTKNSLTDFDMCLALAQKAINSQMAAAWETWIARSEFSTTGEMKDFALVSIFPLRKDGKPSAYGLEAEFAPLTISLNVESAKLGQVKVTLHLKSGTVIYFDEEKEEKSSCEIEDWSISFLTDLDKKPCDLNLLEQIDPKAYEAASQCIKDSGLPDSVFSIEYLFMKFTKVDLLLSDNKDIHIPADVPKAASERARSSLNTLLQGNNGEFMLGTVVRRSKTRSEGSIPTFALTDFIFNVKPDPVPEASTLSYLGMFAKRSLPSNIDTARIALQDNWVRPAMLDGAKGLFSGVMAISKERFVDQYLMGRVAEKLKKTAVQDTSKLKWTFSDATEEKRDTSDIIDRKWNAGKSWNLEIAIVPGSNTLSITGRVSSYAHMDGYTKKLGKLGGYHTEWIRQEGHRKFSSQLTLTGGGSGSTFDLEPDLSELKFEPMQIDKDEIKGGAQVLDALGGVLKEFKFIGRTVSEKLENQQADLVEGLKKHLTEALNQLEMDLSQQSFIPPGAGVFSFQNPRFSPAGDLLFDVIYLAP